MTGQDEPRESELTTSGAKKLKFADETNHAGVYLHPAETEAGGRVPTCALLTILNTITCSNLVHFMGFFAGV